MIGLLEMSIVLDDFKIYNRMIDVIRIGVLDVILDENESTPTLDAGYTVFKMATGLVLANFDAEWTA